MHLFVPFRLLCQLSMSNSEAMLEQCRQKGERKEGTETKDERAATLRCLHIATLLTLTPQCSTVA